MRAIANSQPAGVVRHRGVRDEFAIRCVGVRLLGMEASRPGQPGDSQRPGWCPSSGHGREREVPGVLSIGKLVAGPAAAAYYLDQVARGREDYYAGRG
jgi:hypothetical protein